MTTTRHSPLPFGGPLTSAAMEAPLSQLDSAIVAEEAARAAAIVAETARATAIENIMIAGAAGGWTTVPAEVVDARGGYATLGEKVRGGVFDVRDYGATGDGTTDDTAAIQAAIDAAAVGGGAVILQPRTYRCNVVLKSKVILQGAVAVQGYPMGAGTPPYRGTTFKQAVAGYVIDTPTSAIQNCGIIGVNVLGGGSSVAGGGIYFRSVTRGTIRHLCVAGCADEGILFGTLCGACVIDDVLTTGCVANLTRTAPIGAIDIAGNDHYLSRIEAATYAAGSALVSASFYVNALRIQGTSHFLDAVVGELSDVGFYLATNYSRFVNCRGDGNNGHGFYLNNASFNTFVGCSAHRNSKETTNTYSGFYLAANSLSNVLSGCNATSLVADGRVHKYGLEDVGGSVGSVSAHNMIGSFLSSSEGTAPIYTQPQYGASPLLPGIALNITAGVTTPNVTGTTLILLIDNSSAITITNFLGGLVGQQLRVIGNAHVTIQNNSVIKTNTNADKTLASTYKVYRFTFYSGMWIEDA